MRAVRDATAKPLIVKLTPNTADVARCARAAQDGGADAVSLINTLRAMALAPAAPRGRAQPLAGRRHRRPVRTRDPPRRARPGGGGRGARAHSGDRHGRGAERGARTRSAGRRRDARGGRKRELPRPLRSQRQSHENCDKANRRAAKNPCKPAAITYRSLDVSKPQLEVEMNCGRFLDRPPPVCRLAAHGDGDQYDVHELRNRPRAVAQSADGRARARQSDPHPARPAQARPEVRSPLDPLAAAGAARVRRDREGLRHAARRPQVRAREGQQDPRPLPDLAEQDDRRPLRAPARELVSLLHPAAEPSSISTAARH